MSHRTRGAAWLAAEAHDLGAADATVADAVGPRDERTRPPQLHRWPITDLIADEHLGEWWQVLREFCAPERRRRAA